MIVPILCNTGSPVADYFKSSPFIDDGISEQTSYWRLKFPNLNYWNHLRTMISETVLCLYTVKKNSSGRFSVFTFSEIKQHYMTNDSILLLQNFSNHLRTMLSETTLYLYTVQIFRTVRLAFLNFFEIKQHYITKINILLL